MHIRPEAELLPLDTKLERTLRNLKKVRVIEAVAMEDQEETSQHVPNEPTTERLKDKGPWKSFGGQLS